MNKIEDRLFVGVNSEIFFACIDCCVACIDTIIFNITQAMGQLFAVKQTQGRSKFMQRSTNLIIGTFTSQNYPGPVCCLILRKKIVKN